MNRDKSVSRLTGKRESFSFGATHMKIEPQLLWVNAFGGELNQVDVESVPGRPEFRVRLPISTAGGLN